MHEVRNLLHALIGMRDPDTGKHSDRMGRYAAVIAKGLVADCGLSDEFIINVRLFAPLHDIGKIGIPDHILLKPGKLTPEEKTVMASHVSKGMEILRHLDHNGDASTDPGLTMLRNIVACHHEHLDGTGYPLALRRNQIPLEARIVTVADIFDALSSRRPYKRQWAVGEAFDELNRMSSAGKLDPRCVASIISQVDEVQMIIDEYMA